LEGQLWMVILAAQAIPYVSALIGACVAHLSRGEPQEVVQAGSSSPREESAQSMEGTMAAVH
ncbi:MAG: hypothetical protein ACREPP_03940, partial [Rhodanobacteraceae bacterium]